MQDTEDVRTPGPRSIGPGVRASGARWQPPYPRGVRTSRVRTGVAGAATVGAVGLAAASVVLGSLRLGWPAWWPVSSDTMAMVGAFTDFALPGSALSAALAATALATRPGRGRVVLAALCVGVTAVAAGTLAPRWEAEPAPTTGTRFTVLTLNVELGQADPAAVLEASASADVVALVEVTAPQVDALDRLGFADRFPYRTEGRLPSAGAAGTAVWSRFPITADRPLTPAIAHQTWVTTVAVPGAAAPVTVVAVHPARPYVGGDRWLREQDALRAALPTSGPRVLVGDFNAVASHPTLRALGRDGWTSAVEQTGAGWVPTYPARGLVPPLLDIDHVYVSAGVRATSLRAVPVAGTDHRGLLATLVATG